MVPLEFIHEAIDFRSYQMRQHLAMLSIIDNSCKCNLVCVTIIFPKRRRIYGARGWHFT